MGLAKNLKKLRKKAGFKQREVAENIEVDLRAYQKYEEDRSNPRICTLVKIAAFYGTTVDKLVK